ncbi:hypothetical protein [Beijerinckia sp. L45]|uniref:hypothetical protein n=1 Tax=Beijerinckia sp. L45 TaxID=1641855 RepID=UPI00131C49ED|nr:hypothetical protein [Beijerinckia sp. L45]
MLALAGACLSANIFAAGVAKQPKAKLVILLSLCGLVVSSFVFGAAFDYVITFWRRWH